MTIAEIVHRGYHFKFLGKGVEGEIHWNVSSSLNYNHENNFFWCIFACSEWVWHSFSWETNSSPNSRLNQNTKNAPEKVTSLEGTPLFAVNFQLIFTKTWLLQCVLMNSMRLQHQILHYLIPAPPCCLPQQSRETKSGNWGFGWGEYPKMLNSSKLKGSTHRIGKMIGLPRLW